MSLAQHSVLSVSRLKSAIIMGCLIALSSLPGSAKAADSYISYITGDTADATPRSSSGLLLAGGGDGYDDAMQWMVDQAGRGDVVVIRTSDSSAYNDWMFQMGPNSVETLVVTSHEAASDPYVLDRVRRAEALFIAGGDQSNYVNNWKDTPLEDEVNAVYRRGGIVGGTSAGLAVLGEFVYSAQFGSLRTADALRNPYHQDLTLDRNFLAFPVLKGLLTDSHFGARDRMGRLITMLSRLMVDGWDGSPQGIGIDEGAAIAIDANGVGKMQGVGNAYLVKLTTAPERCVSGRSLTVRHVQIHKIVPGSTVDFANGTWTGGVDYELDVVDGVITSSTGSIY